MKTCPFCAEEIQDAAIVCRYCRADLVKKVPGGSSSPTVILQQAEVPAWNPGVAAVLSLIIPGAGQMYKGHILGGLVWLVVVVIGYMLLIVPGVILHLCCIVSAASGTPPTRSQQAAVSAVLPTSAINLTPRKSSPAEISIGRALALLSHPRIAWPTLSLLGKIGVVIGYATIAALLIAVVRSGR